jgi:hypothetical protein
MVTAGAALFAAITGRLAGFRLARLDTQHGYTPGTAGLLPLSVDGLTVASSLALTNGVRPSLARTGLVLGVRATGRLTISGTGRSY